MARNVELQKMMGLIGEAGITGRTQDPEGWAVTDGAQTGLLQVQAPMVSGCTLVVEGSDDVGGSFTTLAALTASMSGGTMYYLKKSDPFGTEKRLTRYVRWRIDPGAGAWEASFRLNLTLK